MLALRSNNTRELVPPSFQANVVGCRWLFCYKFDSKGDLGFRWLFMASNRHPKLSITVLLFSLLLSTSPTVVLIVPFSLITMWSHLPSSLCWWHYSHSLFLCSHYSYHCSSLLRIFYFIFRPSLLLSWYCYNTVYHWSISLSYLICKGNYLTCWYVNMQSMQHSFWHKV